MNDKHFRKVLPVFRDSFIFDRSRHNHVIKVCDQFFVIKQFTQVFFQFHFVYLNKYSKCMKKEIRKINDAFKADISIIVKLTIHIVNSEFRFNNIAYEG